MVNPFIKISIHNKKIHIDTHLNTNPFSIAKKNYPFFFNEKYIKVNLLLCLLSDISHSIIQDKLYSIIDDIWETNIK